MIFFSFLFSFFFSNWPSLDGAEEYQQMYQLVKLSCSSSQLPTKMQLSSLLCLARRGGNDSMKRREEKKRNYFLFNNVSALQREKYSHSPILEVKLILTAFDYVKSDCHTLYCAGYNLQILCMFICGKRQCASAKFQQERERERELNNLPLFSIFCQAQEGSVILCQTGSIMKFSLVHDKNKFKIRKIQTMQIVPIAQCMGHELYCASSINITMENIS